MDEEQIRHLPQVKPEPIKLGQYTLSKGKYDIYYAMNLLKIILSQVEMYKFQTYSAANMSLSMTHSLTRMLNMLEVEEESIRLGK